MKNARNKQFISFTLCAILSSRMKSWAVPLCPAHNVNFPFIQCVHTVCTAQSLVAVVVIWLTVIVSQCLHSSDSYLIMAPNCNSSDAGSSDVPKRSCKVFPLIEKVCMYNNLPVYRTVYIWFGNVCGFRHPLGVLELFPCGWSGDTTLCEIELWWFPLQ